MALGGEISEEIKNLGLDINDRGKVMVNDDFQTSKDGVFAGGDLINRNRTISFASASGREAANNILNFLKDK